MLDILKSFFDKENKDILKNLNDSLCEYGAFYKLEYIFNKEKCIEFLNSYKGRNWILCNPEWLLNNNGFVWFMTNDGKEFRKSKEGNNLSSTNFFLKFLLSNKGSIFLNSDNGNDWLFSI